MASSSEFQRARNSLAAIFLPGDAGRRRWGLAVWSLRRFGLHRYDTGTITLAPAARAAVRGLGGCDMRGPQRAVEGAGLVDTL